MADINKMIVNVTFLYFKEIPYLYAHLKLRKAKRWV